LAGGQFEGIPVVKIPIAFRRTEGEVRFDETDRDEERLVGLLGGMFESSNRLECKPAIGICVIRHIGGFNRGAARMAVGGSV
jgi:hypothetical protein